LEKDHSCGFSMSPSSSTNSVATTFLIETSFVFRVAHDLLRA
jgi:hypothetical protein